MTDKRPGGFGGTLFDAPATTSDMRYVTFQLRPRGGELHPFGTVVREESAVTRRAVHHFNPLSADRMAILVEFGGAAARLRELVDDQPGIVSSNVTESGDGVFVYAHFRPDEWTQQLYGVSNEHEIFVDMPMYYTEDGALEITVIGELEEIRRSAVALPDGVGLELLSTGEYRPASDGLFEQLTPRQQETLRAAVEVGYYREPREVTYQEVADELGIAAGTVGEHLRKVESTILTDVLPGGAAPTAP